MFSPTDKQGFITRGFKFLSWMRRFFFAAGAIAVAYVALTLLGAKLYQKEASEILDRQIHAEDAHPALAARAPNREGDVLGRLEIPRINLSLVILQGTSAQTLLLGAGHITGTALPGEPGNVGIAGHRDTYFRDLKDIQKDDEINLQTASGISRYRVDWIQITAPRDVAILDGRAGSSLTLVTCYPFHFIGAAPERYVVHARGE